MARVSIYVPDELKARMDQADELNWSAVAQRAFEIELNLARWKMVENATEKVAERLRASKAQEDEELKGEGRAAGQEWAREDASFRVLRAVVYNNWDDLPAEAYGDRLAQLILGEDYPADVGELWNEMRGGYDDNEDEPDPAWLEGFIAGATEVWEEVADKI